MDQPIPPRGIARSVRPILIGAFVAACLVPVGLRAAHPSLYSDDVVRIAQLHEAPTLGAILFRPFNEHMAPLFQAVTWATWRLAGRDLLAMPAAFTLAAVVPHLLCLAMLGVCLRRESRSGLVAMAGVAVFGLSGAITETYHWYSASSFSWALLGTIVAVDAAGRAVRASGRSRIGWLGAATVAAWLAPAGSAIGLLAGPVAMVRFVAEPGGGWRRVVGAAPMVGTAAYLGICALFRYGEVLRQSVAANIDVGRTILNVARAPVDVLLPGLLGWRNIEASVPDAVAVAISIVLLIVVLDRARRRPERRATILVGLAMIVGGYTMTFGLRSQAGSVIGIGVQRYQLFPLVGLILILGAMTGPILSRFEPRRFAVAIGFAGLVLLVQWPNLASNARFFRWPDQRGTLEAIERLAATCRREGITRGQCLGAMVPVRKTWFDHEGTNALDLLPDVAPAARWTDAEAGDRLFRSLGAGDREALCGGMRVDRQLRPAAEVAGSPVVAVGSLVRSSGVSPSPRPGCLIATEYSSFLEFDFAAADPSGLADARVLVVAATGPVEIWWADESGRYSEGRAVRWRAATTAAPDERAVLLSDLPHWDASRVRRLRIAPRRVGAIASAAPRLLR